MPQLHYQDSTIHYTQFGNGPNLLIAIHGFADTGKTFEVLEAALSQQYTVIAFDLPLHGKSNWQKAFYTKADIIAILQLFCAQQNKTSFALMGHSMGTRLIVKMVPNLREQIEHLYFLAPDGLRNKWVFNMNWIPVRLRWWSKRKLEVSDKFQQFIAFLDKKRLIKPIVNTFVQVHLSNPRRRRRLLGVWISHQYFMTYPWQFARLLRKEKIPIDLFYGKKDKIIPARWGQDFVHKIPHARLHLLESNHKLINKELASRLVELLGKL